ncbi:carbamoyltransferase HypF [uncultured Clostridium sp.]|uniref:carbamoyltransferase HypF n=1 Tax=uncultured Clostridium sp. TaxID=59620 RepID=UPI0025902C73|nr:carbamoyltransferase HypF [uncultured Clostridium sp.]MDU1350125.1 carbamoyltransferase HypF [Clostridium argentinense]
MIARYIVKLYGLVQGVGFRPYVYNVAIDFNLKGWVSNEGSSLIIDIEGEKEDIKEALVKIIKTPPPISQIRKVLAKKEAILNYKKFTIRNSKNSEKSYKFLLPDIGICEECMKDIYDENSKWYKYAFTSCTNCGPRYSIIKAIPYDRENTTMEKFKFCNECETMYKNPKDRRFHAQTLSCRECGPILELIDNKRKKIICDDPISEASKLIKLGNIVAIKGIGGFQLCCDGNSDDTVKKLRKRKNRTDKPLALMVKNIETAYKYVYINEKEEEVLKSKESPIVLLKSKKNKNLSKYISPKINSLGIMLPYTPLHSLIFQYGLEVLVMTSGNISGNPMEYKNSEAIENLKDIADYFLIHDREIEIPIDDSVVKVVDNKLLISRLARGYAPYYLNYHIDNHNILASGSEMKNTFSLSNSNTILLGKYCGDLKHLKVFNEYIHSIESIENILDYDNKFVVIDKHPYFNLREYFKRKNLEILEIQHHFAHMVSCIAEHNIKEKVIAVIYDGMGYGDDGEIWGGEFFIGDKKSYERVAHYKYTNIQGGDNSVKNIYKIALSYIELIRDKNLKSKGIDSIKGFLKESIPKNEVDYIVKNHYIALKNNINCFETSSIGRLFDGVASILGIRQVISYDGQGPIELENTIEEGIVESYQYENISIKEIINIDIVPMIEEIITDKINGVSNGVISAKFHNTLINITVDIVKKIRNKFKLNSVVLSGGVFENRYLLENLVKKLKVEGFKVYFNEKVPINDGGISVGQLAAANELINL